VKNTLGTLAVVALTLAAGGVAHAQIAPVPDGGSSLLLVGIAATGCLLFARHRLKK
jgi:hypothetical protein